MAKKPSNMIKSAYRKTFSLFQGTLKRLDLVFFIFFLFSLPLSIRKILWFYPLAGEFNEYTSISIYLSDIFLLLTIFFWFFYSIERNRVYNLSIHSIVHRMFHMEHSMHWPSVFLCCFIVLGVFSIFWSDNQTIATFRIFKVFEGFLLFLYISRSGSFSTHSSNTPQQFVSHETNFQPTQNYSPENHTQIVPRGIIDQKPTASLKTYSFDFEKIRPSERDLNVPRGTAPFSENVSHETVRVGSSAIIPRETMSDEYSTWNNLFLLFGIFFILGILESFLAIGQFVIQGSLGLSFIWESFLDPNQSGIAKIIINEQRFIRGYGTFPHPNILAGFLMTSIWLSVYGFCSTWKQYFIHKYSTWNKIFLIGISIQLVGFFITFSRSAWIGLILSTSLFVFFSIKERRQSETPQKCFTGNKYSYQMFHGKQIIALLFGFILLATSFFLIKLNQNTRGLFLFQSLSERQFYQEKSWILIQEKPLLGQGMGQSVPEMVRFENLDTWQFQPVHNIFLLIFSELGIVGLILFVTLFLSILFEKKNPNVSHETLGFQNSLRFLIIGYIFIFFFDHYFWDIQQGILLFFLIIGLLATQDTARHRRIIQTSMFDTIEVNHNTSSDNCGVIL